MKLIKDLEAKALWLYGKSDGKRVLKALASDGSLAMVLYRLMSFFAASKLTRLPAAFLCKLNSLLCGIVIGMDARFGEGFVILHSRGIVINGKVTGGNWIVLESGVVIGESGRLCPSLGNGIFIGSGAKVFGGIIIGDNVTIGANAVVNKSVENNALAVGVPAKVVRYKKPGETIAP